jgi:hypothetical protein
MTRGLERQPVEVIVKRRSKPNFSFAPERIERLRNTPEFQGIATNDKEPGMERDREIRYGESVQEDILLLLSDMDRKRVYYDRDEFRQKLESVFKGMMRFPPYFWDVMMDALSEREE